MAEAPVFLLVSLLTTWFTNLGFDSILLWAFRFAWVEPLIADAAVSLPGRVAHLEPELP